MQRMFLAGGLALAVLGAAQPARAYEAPWCAVHDFGRNGAYWDCQYRTFEQCLPAVLAGNRGFCNPNPRYLGPQPAPRAKHRRR
jgi:hypothetical protein